MQNIIDRIKKAEIGTNIPIELPILTAANLKLKQNNLPIIPNEFALLLTNFNGLSNEGATVFGAEIESTLFYDLVKYNRNFFKGSFSNILILGYDEVFFLIYDNKEKKYHVIDKDTWEPDISSEKLFEPLSFLMRI